MSRSETPLKHRLSSLAAQMTLVILLALIAAQAISVSILGHAYQSAISDINHRERFNEIKSLVQLLEKAPEKNYTAILKAVKKKGVWTDVSPSYTVKPERMGSTEKNWPESWKSYWVRLIKIMYALKCLIFARIETMAHLKAQTSNAASTE